jgi:hypothetical protein
MDHKFIRSLTVEAPILIYRIKIRLDFPRKVTEASVKTSIC